MKLVKLDDGLYKKAESISKANQSKVDEVIVKALNHGLDSLKEKGILELYRTKKISLQKASEMLSVNMWEMIDKIKSADIHLDYDLEELKEDIA